MSKQLDVFDSAINTCNGASRSFDVPVTRLGIRRIRLAAACILKSIVPTRQGIRDVAAVQYAKGIKKYGVPLDKAGLTRAQILAHAAEELWDAVMYLTAALAAKE